MRPARIALLGVVLPTVLLAAAAGVAAADHEPPKLPDGNVTVSVVDGGRTLSDAADVHRARADGSAFDPPYYLPGDRLLVELRSPGLTAAYAATDGPNATARLFRATNGTDANLTVAQFAVTPERQQSFVSLRESDVRVVPDPGNETFYLLLDTENVTLTDDDGDRLDRDLAYQSFRVVLEAPAEDGVRQVSTADVVFERLEADLRSDTPALNLNGSPAVADPNATTLAVNGSTTVRGNETLTVRAVARNGTTLAAEQVETDAANDSEPYGPSAFAATLPVGSLSMDDSFRLVVERGDDAIRTHDVVVGSPPRLGNLSAAVVAGGERDGEVRVTATVRLPGAGLLAVGDDGRSVAASVPEDEAVTRTLYVGREAVSEDGTVFVYAVRDADGSGNLTDADRSWHVRGGPDLSNRVEVRTPESTRTETAVASAESETVGVTETAATRSIDSGASSPTGANAAAGTTATETPGFGALAAVAASLLLVATARWRSRNREGEGDYS